MVRKTVPLAKVLTIKTLPRFLNSQVHFPLAAACTMDRRLTPIRVTTRLIMVVTACRPLPLLRRHGLE